MMVFLRVRVARLMFTPLPLSLWKLSCVGVSCAPFARSDVNVLSSESVNRCSFPSFCAVGLVASGASVVFLPSFVLRKREGRNEVTFFSFCMAILWNVGVLIYLSLDWHSP